MLYWRGDAAVFVMLFPMSSPIIFWLQTRFVLQLTKFKEASVAARRRAEFLHLPRAGYNYLMLYVTMAIKEVEHIRH